MKTYLADIIPKIKRFSQKLDNITLLTKQHWVVIDEVSKAKNVYIFRENNELLISKDGRVEKAKWEYLGNNALLIDRKDDSYLFRHGFFDENVLALKIDGREEYAFLVNEVKFSKELNTVTDVIGFLKNSYLQPSVQRKIPVSTSLIKDLNRGSSSLEINEGLKCEIKEISEQNLYGVRTKTYLIEFSDCTEGKVYLILKNNRAFYRGINNSTYHYKDIASCIKALHILFTRKEVSKEGFVAKYG